jgi:phosphatidylglycerophosphate synthase
VIQAALAVVIASAAPHRAWAVATALLVCAVTTGVFLRRRPFVVTVADHVTHVRVLLLAAVAGLLVGGAAPGLVLVLVVTSVLLDAVDGRVARARQVASAAGGAFDMAVDCGLTAVLSVAAVPIVGWWAVIIGALPYAFQLAQRFLPALRAPLVPRMSRKVIGSVPPLVLGALGLLPVPIAVAVTAVTLALLLGSFGRDIVALVR